MKGDWCATVERFNPENGSVVDARYSDFGEAWEVARWLTDQAKLLKKEIYMVQRFVGEEPLEGLG